MIKRKFPMLKLGDIITQQGDRRLYNGWPENEKNISEWMTSLAEIDTMLVIIIISLVIRILLFKKWFSNFAKYEKLMNKIQALERLTTDKIQVLERSNEPKPNIHTQAEEFRAESTTPFHDETERERPKVVRKSNLFSPVNIKE